MSAEFVDAAHLAPVLSQLIEGDFQARWDATKRLSVFGPGAIAHLIPLLYDEDLDWEVRWFAARAISTFETEEALNALVDLLQQTQDVELIAITAEGLSQYGERGVSALVNLLEQPSYRLAAVQALATIRHPSVLMPLLTAAEDSDAAVRKIAIAALGNFREPQADAVLIRAVKDVVGVVRKEAINNLGLRTYLLEEMDLVDILRSGLWDLDLEVSKATAIALGRLGTEMAISSLSRVLMSPLTPPDLQIQTVRALGWAEKPTALMTLVTAWEVLSLPVQLEIVATLTQLQSSALQEQVSQLLLTWLETLLQASTAEASALKRAIALGLANLQCSEAEPLLDTMLHDPDEQVRLYAEAALRQLAAGS